MSRAPTIRFAAAVPQFTVPDVVRTAEHYRDVLGFQIADQSPPRTGRADGAYDAYFRVTGVDALAAELRQRGADIIDGPEDRIYQQRELVVGDCNGLVLAFGEDTSQRAT